MKTNIKALNLIEKGLSAKTVSKLTESQINTLHKRLMIEAQVTTTQAVDLTADEIKGGYKVPDTIMAGKKNIEITPNPKSPGGVRLVPTTEEMTEDENVDMEKDPFELSSTQDKRQVGPGDYGDNPNVDKEMDSDDADGMGIMENKKNQKLNPWAICHAQVGPKKTRKFERCVQSVKKQIKEGKNPVSLFIENKIMNIVERNLPPKITKGDLMKYLNEDKNFATKHIQSNFGVKPKSKVKKEVGENSPSTAPTTKPAPTKPGTKTPPKPRPAHPGKNPNPGEKEAPKAKKVSPEKAKEEVLDLIKKILEN
jgi:hypothetical protein